MQLANIDLGKLSVSKLNMRHGKAPPDVSDILPTVRARGVLVPLLVRPSGEGETFEIVAGRRRYFAARTVLEEGGEVEPLPCAIMEPGDDAAALEASLIENIARLDPDEVNQWETFAGLIRKGRTPEQIGQTFGLTLLYVRRILALGNLLPRIRALYAADKIDAATVRHLTLASRSQQKDWLALYDDPEQYAPTGQSLKAWLFGGQSIPTKVAIFDLDAYPGRIKADLFGEDGIFEDADLFWTMQNEAVAALRDRYLEDGWSAIEIMDTGEHFYSYDHEKTPKDKGGKVFIAVSGRGDVTVHEGYLSARRPVAPAPPPPRPKRRRKACRPARASPRRPASCRTISTCTVTPPCARCWRTIPPSPSACSSPTPSPGRRCGPSARRTARSATRPWPTASRPRAPKPSSTPGAAPSSPCLVSTPTTKPSPARRRARRRSSNCSRGW